MLTKLAMSASTLDKKELETQKKLIQLKLRQEGKLINKAQLEKLLNSIS